MKKLKELYKNKIFWTWLLALVGFIGVTLYFLLTQIVTLLIVTGILAVIGLIIDLITKRKKK